MARTVLTTMAANATSSEVEHKGGPVVMEASGTFGSGTLTCQFKPDGGSTFYPVGSTLTAAGLSVIGTLPNGRIRLVLTGATSPSVVPVVNTMAFEKLRSDRGNMHTVSRTNS